MRRRGANDGRTGRAQGQADAGPATQGRQRRPLGIPARRPGGDRRGGARQAGDGGPAMEGMKPYLKNAYIPISPEQSQYMYQTARLIGARNIVEFGTSFGISAIYLAAA